MPPAKEPIPISAISRPAVCGAPAFVAAAAVATSTAPKASPSSAKTSINERTPGACHARPPPTSCATGCHPREAADVAKTSVPPANSTAHVAAEARVDHAPIAPAISPGPTM